MLGVADFCSQLQNGLKGKESAPEVPYELLRRKNAYDVRRYTTKDLTASRNIVVAVSKCEDSQSVNPEQIQRRTQNLIRDVIADKMTVASKEYHSELKINGIWVPLLDHPWI